jgi:HD-GYP domain-containing protein (c-di-GMP phosphodiesterase class II)
MPVLWHYFFMTRPENDVPHLDVHSAWLEEAKLLAVPRRYLINMERFLAEMQEYHPGTYEHSIRVGLLAPKIGTLVPELKGFSLKALFYAGTMHDRGKLKTPVELLNEETTWNDEKTRAMRAHPVDSYKALIKEGMGLTAGVVILHHTFQSNPYPTEIPKPDPRLPEHIASLQPVLGRILALADFYDASHRGNSAGSLSDEEIKAKVYKFNPDVTRLIDKLYEQSVFC